MASLDTAVHKIVLEEKEGDTKVGASTLRPHPHHHTVDRTRSRSRERIRYDEPRFETIRVRDRSIERIYLGDLKPDPRDEEAKRDRVRIRRRREQELDDSRLTRRRIYQPERERDLDRERRVVILERQPSDQLRRSDGDLIRERRPWVDDRLEAEEFLGRERQRTWSPPPPPRPSPPPSMFSPAIPMVLDSQRAALPYRPTSPLLNDPLSSIYRDSLDDDIRRSSTGTRERRPTSDSSLPFTHSRPRSAFATPYSSDEMYYEYDRNFYIDRDRQSGQGSYRPARPASSVVSSEGKRVIYLDDEPSVERRHRHHSSPSFVRRDYYVPPMPPPPVPMYVSRPRATAATAALVTRTSSPARPVVTPAPAAIEPTTANEPTEDIKMRKKLLEFVCPYSPDSVHQNLAKARAKDSGTWLFTLPVFEKWRKMNTADDADAVEGSRSNCIWLSGNLGAGKTMLIYRPSVR
ncbi:hypothetical protein GGR58DRAFT_210973 [Xylaria digitata]|nr:hypothetical protein GGR58DRAFT_210973 [Xylaria digitata]